MTDRGAAPGWTIRPAAQEDLAAIWAAGAADWGLEQADRYIDTLFSVFDLLAAFAQIARARSDARSELRPPEVRIHTSGAHLVIYQPVEGAGIEVIRLLHAHQDLTAYLAADGP